MKNIKHLLQERAPELLRAEIKLVRHVIKNKRKYPPELRTFVRSSKANFAEWQCVIGKKSNGKHLRKCDLFVSSCDLPDGRALFTGVFRNGSGNSPPTLALGDLSPALADIYRVLYRRERARGQKPDERYLFQFRKDSRFADLERRVVIVWGAGARAWVQNFDSNNPKRILPALGEPRPIFNEGYDD